MKKLNLAIVGCGEIAGFMALVSRLVPQVRLAACCDIHAERAQALAARYGIPWMFHDYGELLQKANVDAVYLAVPHDLHYEMILSAARAGKDVLVEKPLTRTLQEGKLLVETIAGHKVGVNYQYRYDSGCYALARAIQKTDLGQIHSVRINVPWHREHSYFEKAAWHTSTARAGGGTLITQGSHFLDVALWALGEGPVSAMGYTAAPCFDVEVETLGHAILETKSGTLISLTSTMAAATEQAVKIEVYGSRGTAIYSDRPVPHTKFVGVRVRKERLPEWGVHALQRSLTGFAKWVLEEKPFLVPMSSTLPVLAAVDAIYRSARSGKREAVDS